MAESLQDRAYFDYLARCEQAFKPHAPIELPDFFAGRTRHIERLEGEISAPGRHVAIFGERGVGKTSLAQLAYFFLRRDEEETHFVRCQKASTFDTIFASVLASAGIELILNGVESEGERHGSISVGPLGLGGTQRARRSYRRLAAGRRIEPQQLLTCFGEREGLIVIDEYDRVGDPGTHTRVAELIKHFSDARSKTKIIMVGVAETLSQLIGEHESLSRSLAQIKLDRMSDDELRDIITRGENHVRLSFEETVKNRTVRLADGFPYFVHLLCRHASRVAGRVLRGRPDGHPIVAEQEYREGLREALENAEHSLADQYERAVITTRRRSEKYELILWAMALSSTPEVQVQDIARNAAFFTKGEPNVASAFSWNLGELSTEKRGNVLEKVHVGYYRFSNPLMRPYIRFVLEQENLFSYGGQLEFPFMR